MENYPLTPRSKKVISLALEFARINHHSYIGTEHLLVGLLSHNDGVASTLLKNCGIDQAALAEKVVNEAKKYWTTTPVSEQKPDLKALAETLHALANELYPLVPKPTDPSGSPS